MRLKLNIKKMEFNNLIETLETIGELVRDQYKNNLRSGNNIATGKLFDSIDYKLEVTDNKVSLYFVALDYYIYIEKGRAAGKFPPIEAIKKWMIAKKIPNTSGRAYLIARSIAKNGIRPKPYLDNIKKLLPSFNDDIKIAIEKDVKEAMKEINEKLKINKQ